MIADDKTADSLFGMALLRGAQMGLVNVFATTLIESAVSLPESRRANIFFVVIFISIIGALPGLVAGALIGAIAGFTAKWPPAFRAVILGASSVFALWLIVSMLFVVCMPFGPDEFELVPLEHIPARMMLPFIATAVLLERWTRVLKPKPLPTAIAL